MAGLIKDPVHGAGRLAVRVAEDDLPWGLPSAARRDRCAHCGVLVNPLDHVRPAVRATLDQMATLGPDEFVVEFGVVLCAETGIVVAKGTSEVHFSVSLTWTRSDSEPRTAAGTHMKPCLGSASRG